MRARLSLWIDRLSTSFWVVPLLMVVLTPGLFVLLRFVDEWVDPGISATVSWAYSGGAVGARTLLTAIAGAMITAASITFSLASVALSIASQQYGSRVLRNYMRDRITQVLLGTFISTFIFSVLVVWTIRGADGPNGFVPAISVTVAIAMALVSLILLIFFVHHVSLSVQASHQLLVVARDLHSASERLYPRSQERQTNGSSTFDRSQPALDLLSDKYGYIQTIDLDSLLNLARDKDLIIELGLKPGDHCIAGFRVARVFGANQIGDDDRSAMLRAFVFGGERTPAQDIRYQFQQLAEIVIRSMSPAINDPFIAVTGIDQIATGIAGMARRPRVPEQMHDESGALRLIIPVPQISEILQNTVGHIAVYAAGDPFVMRRLQRVLDLVAPDVQQGSESSAVAALRIQFEKKVQPVQAANP
jgi:uncharacterized membrane protein